MLFSGRAAENGLDIEGLSSWNRGALGAVKSPLAGRGTAAPAGGRTRGRQVADRSGAIRGAPCHGVLAGWEQPWNHLTTRPCSPSALCIEGPSWLVFNPAVVP